MRIEVAGHHAVLVLIAWVAYEYLVINRNTKAVPLARRKRILLYNLNRKFRGAQSRSSHKLAGTQQGQFHHFLLGLMEGNLNIGAKKIG